MDPVPLRRVSLDPGQTEAIDEGLKSRERAKVVCHGVNVERWDRAFALVEGQRNRAQPRVVVGEVRARRKDERADILIPREPLEFFARTGGLALSPKGPQRSR